MTPIWGTEFFHIMTSLNKFLMTIGVSFQITILDHSYLSIDMGIINYLIDLSLYIKSPIFHRT